MKLNKFISKLQVQLDELFLADPITVSYDTGAKQLIGVTSSDLLFFVIDVPEKTVHKEHIKDIVTAARCTDIHEVEEPEPQSEFTEPTDPEYCIHCDIASKIDGIILARLNTDKVIDDESANVLLKLNAIAMSRGA